MKLIDFIKRVYAFLLTMLKDNKHSIQVLPAITQLQLNCFLLIGSSDLKHNFISKAVGYKLIQKFMPKQIKVCLT